MCERFLGSGAAMVIEALSLCFHLACFQVRGHDPGVRCGHSSSDSLQAMTLSVSVHGPLKRNISLKVFLFNRSTVFNFKFNGNGK